MGWRAEWREGKEEKSREWWVGKKKPGISERVRCATAGGKSLPPLGESTHLWEQKRLWFGLFFSRGNVWGVRSPKHATALCVGTTGGVRVSQFWIAVAHGKEPPI